MEGERKGGEEKDGRRGEKESVRERVKKKRGKKLRMLFQCSYLPVGGRDIKETGKCLSSKRVAVMLFQLCHLTLMGRDKRARSRSCAPPQIETG